MRTPEGQVLPRRPRVPVEGAVYHVYNRLARRTEVFGEPEEIDGFVTLLREVRNRDGLTILAWCVMSNHYHLAVPVGAVPLARTMALVQARSGQGHNRRSGLVGPLRQSRSEVVSRWAARAGEQRREDPALGRRYMDPDAALAASAG